MTAVGGTVGGGGVSGKGGSVCSGLGGKVGVGGTEGGGKDRGVGVGGAVTVGMAAVDGGDGHGGKVRERVNQRTSTKFRNRKQIL